MAKRRFAALWSETMACGKRACAEIGTDFQPIDPNWYRLGAMILLWQDRARQRRALRRMDPDRLADIGVTRDQALVEAAKPFWKP
ncbi:MAG: DUF1127 domain-containing protein [Pseudomonadota bacterium]